MGKMMRPAGVTPMPLATIARFMAVYEQLCPTVDDEVRVEVFAERLGWPLSSVLRGGGVVPRPLPHRHRRRYGRAHPDHRGALSPVR